MSNESGECAAVESAGVPPYLGSAEALRRELAHLKSGWWFLTLGILFALSGFVALLSIIV